MANQIKVNKEPVSVTFNHGYYETEGKALGSNTAVLVSREVKGSGDAPSYEHYTFGEAVSSGAIGDTSHGTIAVSVKLDNSELDGFPGTGAVSWSPVHSTYVVWDEIEHS